MRPIFRMLQVSVAVSAASAAFAYGAAPAALRAVSSEDAGILARAAVSSAFEPASVVAVEPYFAPNGSVSAYSVELRSNAKERTFAAIASARRDDVPVIMMWAGAPRHRNAAVLTSARQAARARFGIEVDAPVRVIWSGIADVWGEYNELDPTTGAGLLVSLTDFVVGEKGQMAARWAHRVAASTPPFQRLDESVASRGQAISTPTGDLAPSRGEEFARHVRAQWGEADAFLAGVARREVPMVTDVAATPAITVTYPSAAGIVWQLTKGYTITWTVTGSVGAKARIELLNGSHTDRTIAESVPSSSGSHTWWVPRDGRLSSGYKIRVSSLTTATRADVSNNTFRVSAYAARPATSTRYISGVPNIYQGTASDCGVVSALDILLFWDRRGYDRLVDGSGLAQARLDLRQAMGWPDPLAGGGTTPLDNDLGITAFCDSSSYRNEYDFDANVDIILFLARVHLRNRCGQARAGPPLRIRRRADQPD